MIHARKRHLDRCLKSLPAETRRWVEACVYTSYPDGTFYMDRSGLRVIFEIPADAPPISMIRHRYTPHQWDASNPHFYLWSVGRRNYWSGCETGGGLPPLLPIGRYV